MAAMRTRGCFPLLPSPASLILTLSVSISESKTTNHSCCVHFGGWTACGKSSRVRLGWEARTVRPRGWVFGSGEREWRRWSRRLSGGVSGVVCCGDGTLTATGRALWQRVICDGKWNEDEIGHATRGGGYSGGSKRQAQLKRICQRCLLTYSAFPRARRRLPDEKSKPRIQLVLLGDGPRISYGG